MRPIKTLLSLVTVVFAFQISSALDNTCSDKIDFSNIEIAMSEASFIMASTGTGTIRTYLGCGVDDVNVKVFSDQAGYPIMTQTNGDGFFEFDSDDYAFPIFEDGFNYEITPMKNDDKLDGLSTLDILLIADILFNNRDNLSPAAFIAADVNKDQQISISDIIELSRLVLGIYDGFPDNMSWIFYDAEQQFPDDTNPWPLTESITLQNKMPNDPVGYDFVGVSVGDVSDALYGSECDDNGGGELDCYTLDLSGLDGSHDAEDDFNDAELSFGNSTVSLTRSFHGSAIADENEINDSQTKGAIGIRMGVDRARNSSNSMTSIFSFSEPVCGLTFSIWDIDGTDVIRVKAYSGDDQVSYKYDLGSCVRRSGNSFRRRNGCSGEADSSRSYKVDFEVEDCIDKVEIEIYGSSRDDGGSYTIVLNEGCTNSDNIKTKDQVAESRSADPILLQLADRQLVKDEAVKVDISYEGLADIKGLQVFMNINNIEIENYNSSFFKDDKSNYHLTDDLFATSLYRVDNADVSNNMLTLNVRSNKTQLLSEALAITHHQLPSEAYVGQSLQTAPLQLSFTDELIKDHFNLSQNRPNPFSHTTEIIFSSSINKTVEFNIYNSVGEMVYQEMINATKGDNMITIGEEELEDSGMYYYSLVSGSYSETKSMIVL